MFYLSFQLLAEPCFSKKKGFFDLCFDLYMSSIPPASIPCQKTFQVPPRPPPFLLPGGPKGIKTPMTAAQVAAFRRNHGGATVAPSTSTKVQRVLDVPLQKKLPVFQLQRCGHCLSWRDVSEKDKCCLSGKNILCPSIFPDWEASYIHLLTSVPGLSRESRMLNNSAAFVSIGTCCSDARRDELCEKGWVRPSGIPKMYGLFGRTYHFVSASNHKPTAFYMFGCDPNECFSPLCNETLRPHLLGLLRYFDQKNAFSQYYKRVADLPQTTKTAHFKRARERIDEPFIAQGTAQDPEVPPLKTFALHPKVGESVFYSALHRCGEVGAYPLIFPTGDGGWYAEKTDISSAKIHRPRFTSHAEVETVHQYVKYMLYQHCDRLTLLGTVFQQWLLDMFSRWQEIVFTYMAKDKNVSSAVRLRLCRFKDIDCTKTNEFGKKGRPFALPATVPGSPAARRKSCRECMAVVSQLGGAHGWITATCNPRWPEVIQAARTMFADKGKNFDDVRTLPPELLAHIATRVYWAKYLNFVRLLRDGHFSFGRRTIWLQIVHEFQQRYFPHFHLLCRFDDYDTLTEEQLDTMYCARLFFYENCPLSMNPSFDISNDQHRSQLRKDTSCSCRAHKLHRIVYNLMQHTCSKNWCRKKGNVRADGTCGKRFPREAGTPTSQRSFVNGNGFFQPRRPYPEDANVVAYNCHVLSYMADQMESGYFAFHNNWDQCAGAHTLEYVFEYQHKGPDFTEISLDEALKDVAAEFREYQRLRHIGFAEAIMRFLKMEMTHNEPGVSEISIHLPNEHFVTVDGMASVEEIRTRLAAKETPLLRYFWRPKDLSYVRLTEYYSLYDLRPQCPTGKVPFKDTPPPQFVSKYVVRRCKPHVCRIEYGSSMKVERYCLGLILRRFARSSFDDCLTVNGIRHMTFSEAAYELGIFSEYNEYEMCLQELINPNPDAWKHARTQKLRVPVVGQIWKARVALLTMIMNGGAAQKLFDDFSFYLTRDAITRDQTTEATADYWLLLWLKSELHKNQMTLEDVGLIDPDPKEVNDARVFEGEAQRVRPETIQNWLGKIHKLDEYQRPIFECVVQAVMNPTSHNGRIFYVDARAGCGKTFLCQCISAFLRSRNKMVLTCAPSALAASLHMGGSTCHRCFGLPATNDRIRRVSSLSPKSYQGTALRLCDLYIIDEFSMFDVLNFDCADRVCRDMCDIDKPFGGKVLLCCGEYAQLPPVVPNGLRVDIIAASCVSHPLWPSITKFQLHKRWRNVNDKPFQNFCDALAADNKDGFFESPKYLPGFRTCTTQKAAVDMLVGTFQDFPQKLETPEQFRILSRTPIYASVVAAYHHHTAIELDTEIAQRVRRRLCEEETLAHATDTATRGVLLTPEFMEEIAKKNHQVPPSTLRLFRGCKIRLLRNFCPSRGLCNGTILLVRKIGRHFIEAQIVADSEFDGNVEVLFRFKFDVETKAIEFSRLQFPIATAFAGTVHRFQGQTVPDNGCLLLDQRKNPFCHGQSFVAFTRAQRCTQVILLTLPNAEMSTCLTYKELTCASSCLSNQGLISAPINLVEEDLSHRVMYDEDEDIYAPSDDGVTVKDPNFDGNRPMGTELWDNDEEMDGILFD